MIRGETVTVITRKEVGRDDFNAPIYEDIETEVENVLIVPGPRNDLPEATRPDGVRVSWTCHFPRTFTAQLRGAQVKVRDDIPRAVIGSPQHYMNHMVPGPWNRPVELEGTDG